MLVGIRREERYKIFAKQVSTAKMAHVGCGGCAVVVWYR